MRKVYIVQPSYDYSEMFRSHGWEVTNQIVDADLIQFTGGEDVSPKLYGEAPHPLTRWNARRDEKEKQYYEYGITNNIPMAGICRGGQFLNVMNGGKMYQHVTNHAGRHLATYSEDGRNVLVTSTHHQMMRPTDKGIIFLRANLGGYKLHMQDGEEMVSTDDEVDVEGVFYSDTLSLCFQPHPEFQGEDKLSDFYFEVINKFIFKE